MGQIQNHDKQYLLNINFKHKIKKHFPPPSTHIGSCIQAWLSVGEGALCLPLSCSVRELYERCMSGLINCFAEWERVMWIKWKTRQ